MNMNLSVLGINFRTAPVELRERASFTAADVPEILSRLSTEFPGSEAVLLSTCNRTELYAAGVDVDTKRSALVRMLLKGTAPQELPEAVKHFYIKKDLVVAEHLLAVVSGLDSMVVGETEILGQVKQAYMLAEQARTSGKPEWDHKSGYRSVLEISVIIGDLLRIRPAGCQRPRSCAFGPRSHQHRALFGEDRAPGNCPNR